LQRDRNRSPVARRCRPDRRLGPAPRRAARCACWYGWLRGGSRDPAVLQVILRSAPRPALACPLAPGFGRDGGRCEAPWLLPLLGPQRDSGRTLRCYRAGCWGRSVALAVRRALGGWHVGSSWPLPALRALLRSWLRVCSFPWPPWHGLLAACPARAGARGAWRRSLEPSVARRRHGPACGLAGQSPCPGGCNGPQLGGWADPARAGRSCARVTRPASLAGVAQALRQAALPFRSRSPALRAALRP